MNVRETGWESVDWINVAQDKNRRRAFVNAVMKVLVTWLKKVISPDRLCFVESLVA